MPGYTNEKNIQIILALLKAHNIKKVIVSPGTCNLNLAVSMQNDPFFEMYSSIDERSAAYMACGLCAESGEPVVITCTEATASRNYMPGLTEAYYRKLPILAITTTHGAEKVGHFVAQVIDHTVLPKDVALYHTYIPSCHTLEDEEQIALKVNEAILELTHRGGGPVYLNVKSIASRDYSVKELPNVCKIERFTYSDPLPELPEGRIGIRIGAHKRMNDDDTDAIDKFCEVNNAVVFCDHTSGYKGKYRVNYALIGGQERYVSDLSKLRLLIHIGEVSGDYFSEGLARRASEVWRVSEDGILRYIGSKIHYVFEMSEKRFFSSYIKGKQMPQNHIINEYRLLRENINNKIGELPFSKIWIASELCLNLPSGSCIHFSILGSLRAGNFFEIPDSVNSDCNVGGFGIDGATSSLIGASLANKDKLYFLMTGDLAFFYDLNAIGNRHIGNNVRILLVNNGDGAEFRMHWHPGYAFSKEKTDEYIAAGGHFGQHSAVLVRHMSEALGFEYLYARTKEEFLLSKDKFLSPMLTDHPILFEVFTDSEVDSETVYAIRNVIEDAGYAKRKIKHQIIDKAKDSLGTEIVDVVKRIINKRK